MKKVAWQRAKEHLDAMRISVEELRSANTNEAARRAWSHLLVHGQRVTSKLAAGSLGGSSAAWYNGVRKALRESRCFQYAQQARHAEEHGIEEITVATEPGLLMTAQDPEQPMEISEVRFVNGRPVLVGDQNKNIEFVEFDRDRIDLVPVRNRGVTYYPPKYVRMKPWLNSTPLEVAEEYFAFLESTVGAAADLIE